MAVNICKRTHYVLKFADKGFASSKREQVASARVAVIVRDITVLYDMRSNNILQNANSEFGEAGS